MKKIFWIIISIVLTLVIAFGLLYWYTDGAILNKDGMINANKEDVLNKRFFAGHSQEYWTDYLLDLYEKNNGTRPAFYQIEINVNGDLLMTFKTSSGSIVEKYTVNKHTKSVKDSNNTVVTK